jgi:hypothetical protein
MIRQAISCDICGAEKKQTNHWFVAYTHAGELRVSGWSAQRRLRAGTKHLCGQTCLNKLLDEFIARSASARAQAPALDAEADEPIVATDSSLTFRTVGAHPASAAKPLPGAVLPSGAPPVASAAVIAIARSHVVDSAHAPGSAPPVDNTPNYASRHWRAEAWERERERCSSVGAHRKSL